MLVKKTNKIIIIFLFLIVGCKEENKVRNINNVKIRLNFPDTVFVNNWYSGNIRYKGNLDTITTSLNDIKKFRYIQYAFTGTKSLKHSIKDLKNSFKDTVYAVNNHSIPIDSIWFGKTGVFYFDGIITDEVSIEGQYKDKRGKPLTRIITNNFRLSKKVVVVDSSAPARIPSR